MRRPVAMLTHNRRWAQNLYRTISPGSDSGQDRPFLQELAQGLAAGGTSATGQLSQVSREGRLLGRELIGGRGPEPAPRLQFGGRKLGLVGRVGEMLRLQAESGATRILHASLTRYRAVQKIPAVKLHSWLRGPHFQHTPGTGVVGTGGQHCFARGSPIQNKIVIVAAPQL